MYLIQACDLIKFYRHFFQATKILNLPNADKMH